MRSVIDWWLSRKIENAVKHGTNHAAVIIGRIGWEQKSHAGQAINALKELGTDKAAGQIGDIGWRHESHREQAIDALKDIGTDEAAAMIGRIGWEHESHAEQAINALQDICTDRAAGQIASIVWRHKSHREQAIDALKDIGTDNAVVRIATISQQNNKESLHGFRAMLERVEANLQVSGLDIPGKTVRNAIVSMYEHFIADTDETYEVLSHTFRQAEQEGTSREELEEDLRKLFDRCEKLVPSLRKDANRGEMSIGTPNAPAR